MDTISRLKKTVTGSISVVIGDDESITFLETTQNTIIRITPADVNKYYKYEALKESTIKTIGSYTGNIKQVSSIAVVANHYFREILTKKEGKHE
jgi:hypothetical protein